MLLAIPHRFLSLKYILSLQHWLVPVYKTPLSINSRTSLSIPAMATESNSILILSGKSSAENEICKSLKTNNTLKLPEDRTVLLSSEIEKTVQDRSFSIDSYMDCLSTAKFGRLLAWSPRLPSTHDVISQNFCEFPMGAVCVADVQFKGRGRSKNVWESPEGCLMFSFSVQMEDGRVVPFVQYIVSLAATEAIKDVCERNGAPYLDMKIKWPNDLYLNGLKVGGILCTSTYREKKFNITAGIGLNVHNKEPTTCLNAVMQELSTAGYRFRREDILAVFFNKFEKLMDLFNNEGFESMKDLYYQTWLHSGQRVIVQDSHEGQSTENVVTVQGLTSSGYLLAIGEDNHMYELHPDGNSFDFFKGLIRRKLE